MKHETKLGIVFIGILLSIFLAMLYKRLQRPTNLSVAQAPPPTSSKLDSAAIKLAVQPAPPTLVTPISESGKPPESIAADGYRSSGDAYRSPGEYNRASDSYRGAETPRNQTDAYHSTADNTAWSRSSRQSEPQQVSSDVAAGQSQPQQPSLLAAPQPIAEVGDRYSSATPQSPRETVDGSGSTSSAQPYRSGYPSTNDGSADLRPETPRATQGAAPSYGSATIASADTSGSGYRTENRATSVATATPMNNANAADRYSTGYVGNAARANEVNSQTAYSTGMNESAQAAQTYPAAIAPAASANVTAAPAPPIQRDGDQYTVQPNDSYWNICERIYGSGGYFKALYEYNRKRHPEANDLKVGQVLSVPDESVLRKSYPDLCPKARKQVAGVQQRLASASGRMRGNGRIYTVEDGDTLFEIARHELGKPSRWAEIYDLNRDVLGQDFDYLRPGLELILPDDKHGDTAARQQTGVYPR